MTPVKAVIVQNSYKDSLRVMLVCDTNLSSAGGDVNVVDGGRTMAL